MSLSKSPYSNEHGTKPLSALVKIKSSFSFLNNDKTLGLIFDQMRVDYPLSDFKLKTITEITDNELLNKRISGATRKSSNIIIRDEEIIDNTSIDEQQSQLKQSSESENNIKTVEKTNKPLNSILIALRYSFILNKSD